MVLRGHASTAEELNSKPAARTGGMRQSNLPIQALSNQPTRLSKFHKALVNTGYTGPNTRTRMNMHMQHVQHHIKTCHMNPTSRHTLSATRGTQDDMHPQDM